MTVKDILFIISGGFILLWENLLYSVHSITKQWHKMRWKQHESVKSFGKCFCLCKNLPAFFFFVLTVNMGVSNDIIFFSWTLNAAARSHIRQLSLSRSFWLTCAGTERICDWPFVNFQYYTLTHWMKQQFFPELWLTGKSGGEKTRLAECLSFCQVLLGPPHNKEMDWQVEKEDREASVIYCLQRGRSVQLLWQPIFQRNQNVLHHLHHGILQIEIKSHLDLWCKKKALSTTMYS